MIFLKMNAFEQAGRWLAAIFCQAIYPVITWLFDLFMTVAKIDILSTQDVQPIYQRITMILTIVMVFYVTFEFVKYVVQPDGITDKEKGAGNIIYKLIAVVILIAFVPKIFGWAYTIQGKILDAEIISKVIYGNSSVNTSEFGKNFSSNIFGMFYKVEPEFEDDSKQPVYEGIVSENLKALRENNSLSSLTAGLYDSSKITTPAGEEIEKARINFQAIFAIIVGGFIVYILALYCVDIGVRWAQMIFLQIMAPIAVIGYLAPKKDGIFQKWCKQCLTTYLDLFLRLAIIYFALLICEILTSSYANNSLFANLGEVGDTMKVFVYIVLVLGVLLFVKKAPDMLKELFPKTGAASGNFGLKPGERVPAAAARLAGAGLGMCLTGAKGLIGSAVNRAKRNHANRDRRQTDKENYKQSKEDYIQARRNRRALNKQIRDGSYMIEEKDANGNTIKRAATREEINRAKKEARQNVRDRQVDRDSAKAARDNSKYRSAVGAGIGGLVGGATRGAVAGSKATDLKGISKQVGEGMKKQDAAMAKTEKWYNEGGGSYFDRAVTSVEKSFGISTQSERVADEIKQYDSQIKSNEALMAIETDVKKGVDAAEDRGKSKIESGELKNPIADGAKIKLGTKNPDGTTRFATVKPGQTVSELYSDYKARADLAKSEADAAAKHKADLENSGTASADEIRIAQEKAERLASAAKTAEFEAGQVKKNSVRYAFSQILASSDPEHLPGVDAVMVSEVRNLQEKVKIATRSSDTVRKMQDLVVTGNLTEEDYNAFMSGNFKDFDQLDTIQTALIEIHNNRARENMRYKESKRKLEASSATSAAKADSSASGGK